MIWILFKLLESVASLWRKSKLEPISMTSKVDIPGFQALDVKFKDFGVILFYRSPNIQEKTDIIKTREYFSNITDPDYIILGDLNIPEALWGFEDAEIDLDDEKSLSEEKQELVDELLNNSRQQYVSFSTRTRLLL